jgi:hypothetical protein
MRQSFYLFLLLVLSSNIFAQTDDEFNLKKDVVDYYWEMSSVDTHLIHYPIELKDNKWTTVSVAEYELEADVNYRKGYIFIKDPANEDDEHASTYRFKLYKRKKNKPLIGISKKRYVDEKWVTEVSFWEERGGKWFNVAEEVLPDLIYQDFLAGGRADHEENEDLVELLPLHYALPKKGNTIKVFLLSEGITAYCMNVDPDNPNCQIRQYIKFQSVDLKWNKAKSKFSIGNFKK